MNNTNEQKKQELTCRGDKLMNLPYTLLKWITGACYITQGLFQCYVAALNGRGLGRSGYMLYAGWRSRRYPASNVYAQYKILYF